MADQIWESVPGARAILQSRVADVIRAHPSFSGGGQEALLLADEILAIPDMANALALAASNVTPVRGPIRIAECQFENAPQALQNSHPWPNLLQPEDWPVTHPAE